MIPHIVAADPKSDGIVAMTNDGLVWLSRGVIAYTPEGWRDFPNYKQIIPPGKQGRQAPTVLTPVQARTLKGELSANLKGWKRNLLTWSGHEMALVDRREVVAARSEKERKKKQAQEDARVLEPPRSFRSPVEGPDYLIGMNAHYLVEALGAFTGNSPVTILWPDKAKALDPILFVQGGARGKWVWERFLVLMPMRTT
jgi:hypothetical protein